MLVEKRVGAKGQPCLYWTSIPFFIPHQLCMPFPLRGNVHSRIITSPVWKSEVNSQPPLHIGRRHTTRVPQSDTPAGPCIQTWGPGAARCRRWERGQHQAPSHCKAGFLAQKCSQHQAQRPSAELPVLGIPQRPWVQFPPQSGSGSWVGELLLEA